MFTDLEWIAQTKPAQELCFVSVLGKKQSEEACFTGYECASHDCYPGGRPCPHPKYHCFLFIDVVGECPPMSRENAVWSCLHHSKKSGKQNQRTGCLCWKYPGFISGKSQWFQLFLCPVTESKSMAH